MEQHKGCIISVSWQVDGISFIQPGATVYWKAMHPKPGSRRKVKGIGVFNGRNAHAARPAPENLTGAAEARSAAALGPASQ